MHDNPAHDWQALAENYRMMLDGELEELAASFGDLTETAQQVLRNELKNRGLPEPGAKAAAPISPQSSAAIRFASTVDPDAGLSHSNDVDQDQDSSPREYTWKTQLCECEDREQAWQISEVLRRAGIESWIERPGARHPVVWDERMVGNLQVLVAADRLDEARGIAVRPIPQEIVDESREKVPEYIPPKCPSCGAEDPVLESAEPSNSWLCEACGRQWTEPAVDADGEAGKAAK